MMSNTPSELVTGTHPRGYREFAGTRSFLLDAEGGFYALREQTLREMGPEFTADILYRAGYASGRNLMAFVSRQPSGELSPLEIALSLLTESGYGYLVSEEPRRAGEMAVTVSDSLEAHVIQEYAGRSEAVCDYLRGLLRGIGEGLSVSEGAAGETPSETLECVETRCVANGDPECRFVIATPQHLAQHRYRVSDAGHNSVRETLLRLNRQLEDVLEAAKRDSLTGLFNRDHFESALRHRIEYANRATDTLAVALIDVDGFKGVNDTQGHGMGDLALRQVGHLLASQARDTDVVARYGGDEFAWLMPGTSMEAALAVADRIRRLVQEAHQEMDLPISLSIGIASYPADAADMADLIDRADAAMYLSKENGGNQVRRYVEAEDYRTAAQKRIRKPRPRLAPGSQPSSPAPSPQDLLKLDLDD